MGQGEEIVALVSLDRFDRLALSVDEVDLYTVQSVPVSQTSNLLVTYPVPGSGRFKSPCCAAASQ